MDRALLTEYFDLINRLTAFKFQVNLSSQEKRLMFALEERIEELEHQFITEQEALNAAPQG